MPRGTRVCLWMWACARASGAVLRSDVLHAEVRPAGQKVSITYVRTNRAGLGDATVWNFWPHDERRLLTLLSSSLSALCTTTHFFPLWSAPIGGIYYRSCPHTRTTVHHHPMVHGYNTLSVTTTTTTTTTTIDQTHPLRA